MALGEYALVKGYALVGVVIIPAETPDDVRRAWQQIGNSVSVVIVTPRAARALGNALADPSSPLSVVLPE
jgi:vacuolar-type H+-ATPase subunit F/Vma7